MFTLKIIYGLIIGILLAIGFMCIFYAGNKLANIMKYENALNEKLIEQQPIINNKKFELFKKGRIEIECKNKEEVELLLKLCERIDVNPSGIVPELYSNNAFHLYYHVIRNKTPLNEYWLNYSEEPSNDSDCITISFKSFLL